MTDLVACLGAGKGTWSSVLRLVKNQDFENIFLVSNQWTKDKLSLDRGNLSFVIVDSNDSAEIIRDKIIAGLKERIKGFEVAVNLESGTGKEHAGLVAALIRLGLAFRVVIAQGSEVRDISCDERFVV